MIPVSIFGITSDISARVLAEKAIKDSEKKYRNLFESSIDAIMLLDLEAGYLDCNPAALELFSLPGSGVTFIIRLPLAGREKKR